MPSRAWSCLPTASAIACSPPKREAARHVIGQDAVDVVVLDVMLPGLDGFEVCSRLRRGNYAPVTPPLPAATTSTSWPAWEAGADDYVVKPVEPRVLTPVSARFPLGGPGGRARRRRPTVNW